ncbi:hypothetical protein GRI89_17280 [Altererythrobacter salegens]|uniref:Uncharacterized protein n=1 Tax=Croceibacterium salegens TaxID=1737568 RepID=A0A6I4T1U0_9SPHN|nr:hypothetical protein [Croceibacterium salegens]MXO61300.1 hypothetical protein [Croceibacterium salegens]
MKAGFANTLFGALLLLAFLCFSFGQASMARGAGSAAQSIDFRQDDFQAQRIARKLLRREIAKYPSGSNWMRTAWVSVSPGETPTLFVMYGCSPTGNCGLYGFKRQKNGWKLVLNSIAQTCSILPSSHAGRHDISARMHGSAFQSTIKTYWWRKDRYVRVSERDLILKE